jgi:hypothetical protein
MWMSSRRPILYGPAQQVAEFVASCGEAGEPSVRTV